MTDADRMRLQAFIEQAPWREVRWRAPGSQMDQHWYLIVGDTIDVATFWALVRLIRDQGYEGVYERPYRPGEPLYNHYLEIGDWVLWAIPPKQLCRTRIEYRQHQRIPEQTTLFEEQR